ncbi:MAG: universal stress protein [Saprospiraceae bacterium]|nr:universal stress protein [Saprospiraceae bacterium]MCF8250555.1 universal stress protein [Saprospiraceae bacterium]MCF8279695.1 universal stress protein [Bacteroidales bacterium]MCF8312481.1 universal stress protein [Saprospiraceae bacterium]MCF8440702.1 universal stress protein [Saprospiraceae bacterium]
MSTTTLPKVKHAAKEIVYPLNVKRVMIGLELNGTDESVLAYFKYIDQFLKAEKISFVYVKPTVSPIFPLLDIYYYPSESAGLNEKQHEQLMEKIEAELKNVFPKEDMAKVSFSVESGPPPEVLAKITDSAHADLVIIGKRAMAEYHVINAMNIVRMVDANVLVAPEKSRPALQTILVPVDFSDYSARALKTAVGFKHAAMQPVKVVGIHIYQDNSLHLYGLGGIPMTYEQDIAGRYKDSFNEFLAEKLPALKDDVDIVLEEHSRPQVAQALLKKAHEIGTDLIIMGNKGHSRLSQLLLGSTTEALLRKNEDIPVLVVK